jgi:hypothetical protein
MYRQEPYEVSAELTYPKIPSINGFKIYSQFPIEHRDYARRLGPAHIDLMNDLTKDRVENLIRQKGLNMNTLDELFSGRDYQPHLTIRDKLKLYPFIKELIPAKMINTYKNRVGTLDEIQEPEARQHNINELNRQLEGIFDRTALPSYPLYSSPQSSSFTFSDDKRKSRKWDYDEERLHYEDATDKDLTGEGLKKNNKWINHVKSTQKKYNLKWKDALIKASSTYKK